MNNQKDFAIAQNELWYRIPKDKAPLNIRENKAKLISFYHTKTFKNENSTIRCFGEIKNISLVRRRELFPKEIENTKTENEYYKIEFFPLRELVIPIISLRPRWQLFIQTTEENFFSAKEINFLFSRSQLEDKFWTTLLRFNIYAEREYFISVSNKNFFLDFALFCKNKNIDIEVDGDLYHMDNDAVRNDKNRNNLLESKGWSVLRFTSKEIEYNLNDSINIIRETVNKCGGIQDMQNPNQFSYLNKNDGQTRMFE